MQWPLKTCLFGVMTLAVWMSNCAPTPLKFANSDPVLYFNDINPIPAPKSIRYERFDYFASAKPSRPALAPLTLPASKNARDVNSMDDVPASSWYFPRLGYQHISPAELLKGPTEFGAPQLPITLFRIRHPEQNPRFFVYDNRGIEYLIKFDPPGFPYIATNSSFIANRLFWGFGYHVPEDHIFQFCRRDLKIDDDLQISIKKLNTLFERVAKPQQGRYRAIASRILPGLPLGTTPEKGVRKQDPNDWFPHQDRRVLRALRVFCAFTNLADISADNTLDMYVGEPDKGYIKHHIVDFDDAFGTQAARENRIWAGYNHIFSMNDILTNFFTLGFYIQDWENLQYTPWPSVGSFESIHFKPEKWKETYPYEPIRNSQPADNYWAAKILAALSRNHIATLVKAAAYPKPQAETYMINTLMQRRHKILKYHLTQTTPLEFVALKKDTLVLKDVCRQGFEPENAGYYRIQFLNEYRKEIHPRITLALQKSILKIPNCTTCIQKAGGYLRIEITKLIKTQPPPAQFHLRKQQNGGIKLVGVVHHAQS